MRPAASVIGLNALLQYTVNGEPLCAIITLPSCQPPTTARAAPLDGPGILQLTDIDTLWRMSKSDGPLSWLAAPNASGRCGGVIVLE